MELLGDIEFYRGDSYPITITIRDKETSDPIDLTGYSFRFTVNKEKDPVDDSQQLFTVNGVLYADPTTGKVSFTPSETHTNQEKGTYYYDIELTDPDGHTRTIAKHKFKITQDISK